MPEKLGHWWGEDGLGLKGITGLEKKGNSRRRGKKKKTQTPRTLKMLGKFLKHEDFSLKEWLTAALQTLLRLSWHHYSQRLFCNRDRQEGGGHNAVFSHLN